MTDPQNLKKEIRHWLQTRVFPLWSKVGVDSKNGSFIESLSFNCEALPGPQRALVQARQIYSFAEGFRLEVLDRDLARKIVHQSTETYISQYALPNGAFVHSVDSNGHLNKDLDLYTQAFAIFGLSQGYEITKNPAFKNAALAVVTYLKKDRRNPAGGFTEIKAGKTLFQSNPHMHLFEAAIAWARIDQDPTWNELAHEIFELCRSKFIDPKTGFLAEQFNSDWQPILENNRFIFEPGHHFEWSWLLYQYQKVTRASCQDVSESLFRLAEKYGLSEDRTLAYDEIWSDGTPHKRSSRFWPQTERVKAAVVLQKHESADQAMQSLIQNYLMMDKGLWKDTLLENKSYADVPAKASSLYHIINAMAEYLVRR